MRMMTIPISGAAISLPAKPNRIAPISGAAISLAAKLIRIVPYHWSCDITISEAHQGSPVSNPILTNTCAPHVSHTSNHAPRGTSYSKHVLLAYSGSRPLPDGLEKHCLGRRLSAHHNISGKSSNHLTSIDVQLTS